MLISIRIKPRTCSQFLIPRRCHGEQVHQKIKSVYRRTRRKTRKQKIGYWQMRNVSDPLITGTSVLLSFFCCEFPIK